jgi:hypothetical protein
MLVSIAFGRRRGKLRMPNAGEAMMLGDGSAKLATIDGAVQQLAIHTVGGVVAPAEQLLVVVPDDGSLVVEAMVPNRDVGFVHEGQEVEVKIETFTFTRYGLIHDRVVGVSRDTVTDDQRKPDRPDERDRSNAKGDADNSGSPAYVARVALDRTSLNVDGEARTLRAGHGRHRRDQDRKPADLELSALAAPPICRRCREGTMNAMNQGRKSGSYWHIICGAIMTLLPMLSSCSFAFAQVLGVGDEKSINLINNLTEADGVRIYQKYSAKYPESLFDLLENIQKILKYDLLLDVNFYTKSNLGIFFGGQEVKNTYDAKNLKEMEVKRLANLFEMSNSSPGAKVYIECSFEFSNENTNDIIKTSYFSFGTGADSRLTREVIERYFPDPKEDLTTKSNILKYPDSMTVSPSMEGGENVVYLYNEAEFGVRSYLRLGFYSDGRLLGLNLRQERIS